LKYSNFSTKKLIFAIYIILKNQLKMKGKINHYVHAILFIITLSFTSIAFAQQKPKLMIGIVVDQMRWDYIYKFQHRYGANGFNKIVKNGFSQENTFIPYTPTVTAIGHSSIYTGSVPAITGIVGNNWFNKSLNRMVYCVEDSTVIGIGSKNANGKMSPRNMLTSTIADELKIATNFKSKSVGIALKDRGSILPAGHSADAAYWYDAASGNWITSSFYSAELPNWVTNFNNRKVVDSFYNLNWNTKLPIQTYTLSTTDEKTYEGKMKRASSTSFPHILTSYIGKDYDVISGTPYGNTLTFMMAKEAIQNFKLGKNNVTDFLAISLSSPDYIGHRNGPNSIEIEDNYIRLDADIADFIAYLEKYLGKNNFTFFISADHGVAHIPGFLQENKIPAGTWDNELLIKNLKTLVNEKFGSSSIISGETNYQIYLNDNEIIKTNNDKTTITTFVIDYLKKQPGIAQVFKTADLAITPIQPLIKQRMSNGYNTKRSGDIQIILEPAWIDGNGIGTTHGLWNPYDSHIPMLWYGAGIKQGKAFNTRHMTDIAPTIAALLQIQMPNGCVGEVMTEVLK
jgi:predicted AlkP superfamily pyrophosphatase or phosphodiesterase